MILGFTGTQVGMTDHQKQLFTELLFRVHPFEFHHGDCVGADADAHDLIREYDPGVCIHIHPPTLAAKRAMKKGDVSHRAKPYLDRNKDIVDSCNLLVATPQTMEEVLRSGTWSTVRYAKKNGVSTIILPPHV